MCRVHRGFPHSGEFLIARLQDPVGSIRLLPNNCAVGWHWINYCIGFILVAANSRLIRFRPESSLRQSDIQSHTTSLSLGSCKYEHGQRGYQ